MNGERTMPKQYGFDFEGSKLAKDGKADKKQVLGAGLTDKVNKMSDIGIKKEDKEVKASDKRKSNFNLSNLIKSMHGLDLRTIDKRLTTPVVFETKAELEQEQENDHSSGDEKLSKAFGVDLSYSIKLRGNHEPCMDSVEWDDPDVGKSMHTDELRTLKFCTNDEDSDPDNFKPLSSDRKFVPRNQRPLFTSFRAKQEDKKKDFSLFSTEDSRKALLERTHSSQHSNNLDRLNISDYDGKLNSNEQKELTNLTGEYMQKLGSNKKSQYDMLNGYRDYCYETETQFNKAPTLTHYVPNIDMTLIKGVGYSNMDKMFFPKYSYEQSSDSMMQKKGKRNFWKIDDTSEFDIVPETNYSLNKTTLMIRNIPNKYTKELMLETIDVKFKGSYDFFYLPIDFKNNCNVGYAFINFKDLKFIEPFYKHFNETKWPIFNSEKICSIKYARLQGKEECEKHFRDSSLMKQPVS